MINFIYVNNQPFSWNIYFAFTQGRKSGYMLVTPNWCQKGIVFRHNQCLHHHDIIIRFVCRKMHCPLTTADDRLAELPLGALPLDPTRSTTPWNTCVPRDTTPDRCTPEFTFNTLSVHIAPLVMASKLYLICLDNNNNYTKIC